MDYDWLMSSSGSLNKCCWLSSNSRWDKDASYASGSVKMLISSCASSSAVISDCFIVLSFLFVGVLGLVF